MGTHVDVLGNADEQDTGGRAEALAGGDGLWPTKCSLTASTIQMDPLLASTTETIDNFSDISVPVEGRFEERLMNVQEVLAFRPGAVIPMHRAAGETLRVYVDNVLLASAEVIVIEDHLALRITEFERLDA